MASTFVKDIMKKDVISLDSSKTAKDAVTLMTKSDIGCVIITEKNTPVGILTERDFVRVICGNDMPMDSPVATIMSSPLITINSEETVWELAELMKVKKIHKVPVLDGENLVGITTATDLVSIASAGSNSEMRKLCDAILSRMTPKDTN